ncbi:carbohydrate ABC transporter, N-acetylglucosamine/diacetylchitobiose-binding protein [Streptomyces sp. TRM66268-LWL]|uniref:Carbohydrate ABC transporter, N-acetylglucosamine/diacetylchitobiose-binding protein n=1 Tax=Streptomyces polyasparticus TaxID=2767826 RepID=A0ABR7SCD1_9ACTN|nr:N-acetylglucosamine/diacetylchitobiose ABC transporter substrate-binding protein [Streptomyces polyasparticus]MBC9713135.1 carbohydrate ABC transporter, N-acetylglucosamine/diacetylchitobiose-binding protein [Streptomyces polyasparticus]
MTTRMGSLDRRMFLRGAIAAAVTASMATACSSPSSNTDKGGPKGDKSAKNPFGVAKNSKVEAAIFDGGYGTDYVGFVNTVIGKQISGVKVDVKPVVDIAPELQPRFVGGNPPDLIDNSGEDQIGFLGILDQLETLDDVLEANNYEGTKIADTIYAGVKNPGTYNGKFVALNYVMTVYGVWYSQSLFEANGWTAPKTWDEAYELGKKAKEKGKYLFVHGKEAATYYQTLLIESAIKEGGDEVRLSLEKLEADSWSHPAVQGVLKVMEKMVKEKMFVPGGSGTQFQKAQAIWSNDQKALLYPTGGWIENEMKDATKADFKMTGIPSMTLTADSKMPYEAVHAAAGEPFIVPKQAKNSAGGKEVLRAMLSKEAAANFSKTKLAPTIVKGTVPADGYGSSALVSQSKMLEAAGENIFTFNFVGAYGINTDMLVPWNSFLGGDLDAKGLTSALQKISDKIREDDSIEKFEVS